LKSYRRWNWVAMPELTSAPFGFGPLAGTSGFVLLLGLCALLFIEECGVPLLFAPGDAVLLVCGITVATNHLNLVVASAVIAISVIGGALVGRELFARAGGPLVYRVASFLNVRGVLDRVTGALRRRGSLGVFAGRLTPGLRVHTTEAAGLIGMSRRTFAVGLVPAAMAYQAIFFGLGFWLGPAANQAIHEYTPRPVPLLFLLAAAVGVVATARWLVARLPFGAWTAIRSRIGA
jgi:membrane protein DedA with SNARE-associated domain